MKAMPIWARAFRRSTLHRWVSKSDSGLADLGVFIRLLRRSATGQPITTYTSHFHGPIAGGEMHIIIVDNGRSKVLADPDFRRSLNCIRCGAV